MAVKRRKSPTITLTKDEAYQLLDTLDMLEELLSLVEGPLNGQTGTCVHALFSYIQDNAIADVRLPLADKMRAAGMTETEDEDPENADDTKA